MKMNACSFTGHRKIAKAALPSLKESLKKEISALAENGISEFITGGALGFDTLAATVILSLKSKYPDIKLSLYLPCPEQDKLWSNEEKEIYRGIIEKADNIKYVSDRYTDKCMLDRNRAMIDNSCVCIAYYDGRPRSGTAMTVNYAKKNEVKVINLY